MGSNYVVTGGSFISEDELCHYGIKGQKWGVRRYQNEDGTLTAAGRKRLQKQDAKYVKKHPDRAKTATDLRDKVIENQKRSINRAQKLLKSDSKMANENIDNIDFEKEAVKQLKEELDLLKEDYATRGLSRVPTEKDAINSFYSSLGMKTPMGAQIKDVASVIRADTEILKKNKTYDKLIEQDKKNIVTGERIIKTISDMPLKDIYDNKNDMYYKYWKNKGYYD